MAEEGRYSNIDGLRGCAALAVLFQHALEVGRIEHHGQPGFGFTWLNFGEVGVCSFFLISGFVIPLSLERWNDVARFAASRLLRIYPLYLLALVLSSLLIAVPIDWRDGVAHLFLLQEYVGRSNIVGVSWTLSLEMVWYVTFAGLFLLGLNRHSVLITALTVMVLGLASASPLLGGPPLPMGRLGLLATCVVGLLAYRIQQGEDRRRHLWCIAVLVAFIATGLYVRFALFPSVKVGVPSFRCILISWFLGYLAFAIIFLQRSFGRLQPVLIFLGTISYSIYIMHAYVLHLLDGTPITGWALVATTLLLTVPIAYVSYRFVERPFIRLSHRYPWRDRAAIAREAPSLEAVR